MVHSAEDSSAIPNTAVWLVGTTHTTYTNSLGFFRLRDVEPGSYTFEIRAGGHNNYISKFSLGDREDLHVEAYLSVANVEHDNAVFKRHFAVKMKGGLNRWRMGDWNTYYKSQSYVTINETFGMYQTFVGDDLKWGGDSEIELVYHSSLRIRVGLGIGYSWGDSHFNYESIAGGFGSKDFESLSVKTVPIFLTIYTNNPFGTEPVYFGIEIGYYMSSVAHRSNSISSVSWTRHISSEFKGSGIGGHAIVGGEYFLTQNSTIIIELKGTYNRISHLEGKTRETLNNDSPEEYDSILYLLQDIVLTSGKYSGTSPQAYPIGTEPKRYSNQERWRKMSIDHSGVALRLGVAHHF
ncbi:carboxypeptidase-like regulatory domain-containing protein [candidate division KSB1 bacterium]